MDRDTPVKRSGVVPITPGSSFLTRRGQGWLERDFDTIFDDFRRSFDVLMRPYFPMEMQELDPSLATRFAPLDVIDGGDHFLVHLEVPGFSRDQVEVQVSSDGLHLRAKKETTSEVEKKHYLHRERAYSAFERSVTFPEEVDPDKAIGEMKDGVLELKVPKKEPKPEVQPRKLELK